MHKRCTNIDSRNNSSSEQGSKDGISVLHAVSAGSGIKKRNISCGVHSEDRVLLIDVFKYLRQRPPFLFVDSARLLSPREIETEVLFRRDADFFRGHFPGNPVVPGVLIIEAMAQSARILLNHAAGENREGFLIGIENARFNMLVQPDQKISIMTRLVEEIETASLLKSFCTQNANRCARAQINLYKIERK